MKNIKQKIKNNTKLNPQVLNAITRKLYSTGVISQSINLMLNMAFKFRKKLNSGSYGVKGKAGHCLNLSTITKPNIQLFHDSILIMAELSIPQCTKYRVTQKVKMLKHLGKAVNVVSWADFEEAKNLMQTVGTIIFYRVPAFEDVKALFSEAKYLGIKTYYDIDDLIFDRERLKENTSLSYLPPVDIEGLLDGAFLYKEAIRLADYGIASTESLAEQMRACMGREVYMLNNAIDQDSIDSAKSVIKAVHKGEISIVYGSGTNTHNADFLECADALLKILSEYPNVNFVIYGHLQLDNRFDVYESQIFRVSFVEATDYYKALGSYDIAIAPLENNIFNDCKSNIKYIESSLVKIPCICSPRAEFKTIVKHGINGFLADTDQEWYDAFKQLIDDKELRYSMPDNAYNDSLNTYHWKKIADSQLKPLFKSYTRYKKRILIVNIFFKPESMGGATIIAENTAKLLNDADDFEVLVFCGTFSSDLEHKQIIRYETDDGVPVVKARITESLGPESNYNNPVMAEIFGQVVTAWDPDLVHFHSIDHMGASLANVCIASEIPYIITLHDAWWFCERQFMITGENKFCFNYIADLARCAKCVPDPAFNHHRRFYLQEILNQAKLLLTPGQFQKDLYIQTGVNPDKIVVNKNGVMPVQDEFRQLRMTDSTKNHKLRFVYLGGKAVHKGYYCLQDVFSKIDFGNYVLKLVAIESRLGVNGVSKKDWKLGSTGGCVEIVPYFNQDTLDEFFSGVDVLLFPSQWKESFGLVVREALLRDIWVIATDCGGPIEDIVDGVNGNITTFGDTGAFRQAVENVLRNPRATYINPLKDKIVTIDQQVKQLKSIYLSILHE